MTLAARTQRAAFGGSCNARTSSRRSVRASANPVCHSQSLGTTVTAVALMLASATVPPAFAVGIESIDLPEVKPIEAFKGFSEGARQKEAEAEEAFRNSDTLKRLLEKSEANKAKNRREVQNKYCYRQAEWGVGDCGGLNDIPGLTQNGKQETPDWLAKLLGVEEKVKEQKSQQPSIKLEDLLGPKPAF